MLLQSGSSNRPPADFCWPMKVCFAVQFGPIGLRFDPSFLFVHVCPADAFAPAANFHQDRHEIHADEGQMIAGRDLIAFFDSRIGQEAVLFQLSQLLSEDFVCDTGNAASQSSVANAGMEPDFKQDGELPLAIEQ